MSNQQDLPFLGEGQRNFELWLEMQRRVNLAGAPIFRTTGMLTGNGGGIKIAGSGLFALDYTNDTGFDLIAFLFGTYRVDQAYTGGWVWGQGDLIITGATAFTNPLRRAGYVLHGSGVFFVQTFMWSLVRIPKNSSMHALVSARAQIDDIHAWTAADENDLSMMAWRESA